MYIGTWISRLVRVGMISSYGFDINTSNSHYFYIIFFTATSYIFYMLFPESYVVNKNHKIQATTYEGKHNITHYTNMQTLSVWIHFHTNLPSF